MKKNNTIKILIIFFLLAIPIYILYFNESQNSISIFNLNKNFKETFSNYINICKNGEIPEYYNINHYNKIDNINSTEISGCNYYCNNDISRCIMYTVKDNSCFLYDKTNDSINVHCASKKQNELSDTKKSSIELNHYKGIGFVKDTYYYTDGSNSFHYNDIILDNANIIKNKITEIQNLKTHSPDDPSIINKYTEIDNIKTNLSDYLDISMHNLFSTLDIGLNTFNSTTELNPNTPVRNTINFNDKDISMNYAFNIFKDLNNSINNIDSAQEFNQLEYNRRNLIYTILGFIMIISFIILLLHKFIPNLIPNFTLIIYFVGIILLLTFIHFILKQ